MQLVMFIICVVDVGGRPIPTPLGVGWPLALPFRPFQFQKRSQLFIGTDNETLSVAVSVSNPDRAPFRIEGCYPAPTPTGFAETVGDDFPGFHESDTLVVVLHHLRRRFARFELGAHLLDLRGLLFELGR